MSNQQDVVKELNQQVANWTVAYTKLHNFHWYVKGPNFFSLHVKFEELYNEASQYVDELAERILAVGGNPVGTLTECLEQSIVKEAVKGYTAEQMVEELSQDFTNISKQLENAIEIAGNAGDDVSEDMFIGMQTSVDKHNWMFKSYLS
ncbi:DNA starvation/stationary phase protection protein [Staphylococcus aureus]|uniref:Dps family protein n=1 Tax=Staphylococcus aureus TaxID=1280 RepID=UPI00021ADA61|nr:Dps family protein [Staphylococcus aureus]EGS81130.1 DNA protection during starvation protein 2 [Staphylococcus aureus subsp. aureus 21235]MCQ1289621.1 DNA starvation/stationary phase protection protein [Staphylococcus aureus]MRW59542.1 DNA starvation/stationary phase protection protein [Staphylococcus aureus]MRW77139.1 DNA starvation/stationary phase protection protein [Staphylococcus aureus]NEF67063.1 DNA starvation/stationary phase protection protein [Staphylococcus aureus]